MTYGVYSTGVEDYGSTPVWAGSTPVPLVAVEAAFTTNPGSTPVWVNLGERVKAFTVHRGRADELSTFNAGQATITLNNEDRAFDPNYTASPYYPNVIPMRRIRIRATYAAVTYDVFNGYVTNWQQQYSPPQDADAVVECSDAFKVLGNVVLAPSVWAVELKADSPVVWFPLNEAAGSTAVTDIVGGRTASLISTPTLGAAGLVTRDAGTAAQLASSATGFPGFDTGTLPAAIVTAYPMTLSAIYKGTQNVTLVNLFDTVTGFQAATLYVSSNKAYFDVFNTAAGFAETVSAATVTDGNPHLITGVWDASGTVTVYVDGVASGTPASLTGTARPATRLVIGNSTPLDQIIDEVAVFNTAVPAARIAVWASARSAPWVGDLTGTRVGRILDAAGWPAADRNVDAGTSTLQSSDAGQAALTMLQAVEQTEFGALFVTAGGQVRFIGRASLLKAPYTTSQATFGDSGSELEFGDLTFEYDDRLIYNEAQVSRSNGGVQIVADTTSQTKYLRRTKVVSGLLHQADSTSLSAAYWLVNHYKDPLLRVTGLRLEPAAGNDATHYPQVLGRELMDRVTINRRPQNLGAAITQDSQIQGITHQVNMKQGWVTRWDLAPAETQAYWIAGVAGFSEAGQTTRAGF